MPEPFKNVFNTQLIRLMADHLSKAGSDFRKKAFVEIASRDLDTLELKERSNQIVAALEAGLPEDFRSACAMMLEALDAESVSESYKTDIDSSGIHSWGIMPMADYVARHGLGDFDFSMQTLRKFTMRFTAEFAIRPFIAKDPKRAMKHISTWTTDSNLHVRRLCSEGTRPRLPWGMRLQAFVEDPAPILPILETLKDDSEEYVRRSVANNLNDIAKDHPQLVAQIATDWLPSANPNTKRLVRHACRTLIKQGHLATLKALGYSRPKINFSELRVVTPNVRLGESLEIQIELTSTSAKPQALIIDYIVHHQKANGSTAPKVFKWKVLELAPDKTLSIAKKHMIRAISTRTYYAGEHEVEIQINGQSYGRSKFDLAL